MAKDKNDFFDRVFKIVARIPKGKVTTYGAIAEVCGIKSSARTVGWALIEFDKKGCVNMKKHFWQPVIKIK